MASNDKRDYFTLLEWGYKTESPITTLLEEFQMDRAAETGIVVGVRKYFLYCICHAPYGGGSGSCVDA